MKKTLALFLAVLMVAALFVGCGSSDSGNPNNNNNNNNNTNNNTNNDDPLLGTPGHYDYGDRFKNITIRIAVQGEYTGEEWFFQKAEEVIGCNIELLCFGSAGTYTEKVNAMLATGDIPDLFQPVVSISEINTYGDQSAFVNLMDPANLAKMPNFKAVYVDNAENYDRYMRTASSTGAHYVIPHYESSRDVNHGWMYRDDVFTELGLEMWTDLDSFLYTLRELKKAYPDSYPMAGADWEDTLNRWMYSFNTNNQYTAYNWETGKWYIGADSEDYYTMLETLQTLYKEKLMDPDMITNSGTGAIDSAIINDKSFVYHSWIGRMSIQNNNADLIAKGGHVSPAPPVGTNGMGIELEKFVAHGGSAIANNANKEATMALVNWLYDDTPGGGGYCITVGEEGDNFTVVDGKRVYKGLEDVAIITINDLAEEYGMWEAVLYYNMSEDSVYFDFTEEEQLAQDIGNAAGYYRTVPPFPVASTQINDLKASMTGDIKAFVQKYVTENLTRADYDAFIRDLHNKYDAVIEAYNADN